MVRLIASALILLAAAPAASQSPLVLEGWTDEDTKVAGALMSFACKASPGENLDPCEAAILLRRKLAAAKRSPLPDERPPVPGMPPDPPKPATPRVE